MRFSSATILALLTLISSIAVALIVNGTVFDHVKITDLAYWGGVTWQNILEGQIWRIATAQLVHVKLLHMLFNVLCLYLIAKLVEGQAGNASVLLIWFVGGGLATLISPIITPPPYNVGTGASQAVLALGGYALTLFSKKHFTTQYCCAIIALAIVPPFMIDFLAVGYPKIGHIVALVLGILLGITRKTICKLTSETPHI